MSVKVVTDATFKADVLEGGSVPVLVDFWAEWCGPCKMLAPILSSISDKRSDVKICKVDVDSNSAVAQQYQIASIPCCIMFKNGKEVGRIVGHRPESAFNDEITKLIAKA